MFSFAAPCGGLMILLVTNSRLFTQASAIWAGDRYSGAPVRNRRVASAACSPVYRETLMQVKPRLFQPLATQVLAGKHEGQRRIRQQPGAFTVGKLRQSGFERTVQQAVRVLDNTTRGQPFSRDSRRYSMVPQGVSFDRPVAYFALLASSSRAPRVSSIGVMVSLGLRT